jgi:hypothetical protein
LNQIRAISCGVSTGTYNNLNPYNLEPTFNNFDDAAVRALAFQSRNWS